MRSGRVTAMLAWLGLCVTLPAIGGGDSAAVAERKQIRLERAEAEGRYRQGEADCAKRFFVTACVTALQAQRRDALARLRDREIALDEAERTRETEESALRLQKKRAEAQTRPPPEPRPAPAPRASAAAPTKSERAQQRSKTADDTGEAAARVAAQQRRASEAAARRDEVEKRAAERAAKGKKSTPLPIPAPLPPASAASQ